jgi:hypothetical protein
MLPLPITEFDVQALVDSHLTWEKEKQVRREMRKNQALEDHYRQVIAQKKLIILWWQDEFKNTPVH